MNATEQWQPEGQRTESDGAVRPGRHLDEYRFEFCVKLRSKSTVLMTNGHSWMTQLYC